MTFRSTPSWDQETTLGGARDQVRRRVEEQAARRNVAARWIGGVDPAAELDTIRGLGRGVVVGSEMALWRWSPDALARLCELVRELDGLLVFIEPTAGLGWRRLLQLPGRRYRRDIPAELRAAGFIVTTQVRLRHGGYGTYVRGEARHIASVAE